MSESEQLVVIEPNPSGRHYLRELWRFRELFVELARRDVMLRYKQTFFGVAWALVRPVATTVVFTFAFGRVAGLSSEGVPYSLFVLAGALIWQLFASALADGGGSVLANAHIISKTYFPRMIVPTSSLMVSLVDLSVSAAVLVALMLWERLPFSPRMLLAPVFVLLAAGISLGTALWLSALHVRYRDVRHIVPFVVQFGLFVTPVGYGSNEVPRWLSAVYHYNPLVAPIDGLRWCLFGVPMREAVPTLAASVLLAVGLLLSGYLFFRKTETTFADVL